MNESYYMLEQRARMIQKDKESQALKRRRFQKARRAIQKSAK